MSVATATSYYALDVIYDVLTLCMYKFLCVITLLKKIQTSPKCTGELTGTNNL